MKRTNERNGLQSYDRIRGLIAHIYLYGFLSRTDIPDSLRMSRDEYDQCIRLLRSVVPNLEQGTWEERKRRYPNLLRSYLSSNESQLVNTYLLHTIRPRELMDALLIGSYLTGHPQGAVQRELTGYLERHSVEEGEKDSAARYSKKEMEAYGYLTHEGYVYRRRPDVLAQLSDEALVELYDYIWFLSQSAYPRVAAAALMRNLYRRLILRGLTERVEEFPFLFRHNDSKSVLDENDVYLIREAIEEHRWITAQHRGQERRMLPIRLRIDENLGRWYLLWWDGWAHLERLSNLRQIRPDAPEDRQNWEQWAQKALECCRYSGISGRFSGKGGKTVRLELCFDSGGQQRQFCREIRLGKLRRDGDRTFDVIRVQDPMELVPVLRKYSPWLRLERENEDLRRELLGDLEAMERHLKEDMSDGTVS